MNGARESDAIRSDASWRVAISVEAVVIAFIFFVALGLRTIELGSTPLSDTEAAQAIAAWKTLNPPFPIQGEIRSPLVFTTTLASLFIAGASNSAVRFGPMLGGMLLVLAPLLLRKRSGRLSTIVSMALLAISPVAVSASRQLDGTIYAMAAILVGLTAAERYISTRAPANIVNVAVAVAVALLADYGSLVPIAALLFGVAIMVVTDEEDAISRASLQRYLMSVPWGLFVIAFVAALVALGTLLFIVPQGIGALGDQLVRFAGGIFSPPQNSPFLGTILLAYESGIVLFGTAGSWTLMQSPEPWKRFVSGWGIATLMLALLYRGALPVHSLWVVVPLALLSGMLIEDAVRLRHNAPQWVIGLNILGTIALIAMILLTVSEYLRQPLVFTFPFDVPLEAAILSFPVQPVLAVLYVILCLSLFFAMASMWGMNAMIQSICATLLICAFMGGIGQSSTIAFTRDSTSYEILHYRPALPTLSLMVETAYHLGKLGVGDAAEASVTIQGESNFALAWAFRDFRNIRVVDRLDPGTQDVFVITPLASTNPALGSGYSGQRFAVDQAWRPQGLSVAEFVDWLLYRHSSAPLERNEAILWVRNDIYQLARADFSDQNRE